jgi:hypothetical protein
MKEAPHEAGQGERHQKSDSSPLTALNQDRQTFVERQLDLFGSRCAELVERVRFGCIGFIDAVDLAWSAAIWSGLVDSAGPDAVQEVMRQHFMRLRR